MATRLEAFSELSSSFIEKNSRLDELVSFACSDISSQCGFEVSNDAIDFLVCIDQLAIPEILTSEDIVARTSPYVPYEVLSRVTNQYSKLHHVWLEFDSKSDFDLGGIFICFKAHVYLDDNYSKIRSMMDIFGITYDNFEGGIEQLQPVLNENSVTLTELGYMPGRDNCPIRLCFHTGNAEQTKLVFNKLFPDHQISIDNFFETSISPELVEHYFLDLDLHESSIVFNGVESFPLARRSFTSEMFSQSGIGEEKTRCIFNPSAIHLRESELIDEHRDQPHGNYILRRGLNHVKYTAKSSLMEAKFYISIEYIYLKNASTINAHKTLLDSSLPYHFDGWAVLHQANNFQYLMTSREMHKAMISNFSRIAKVRTIKHDSLWEVNNWISEYDVHAARESCLSSSHWSFSNKGDEQQIVPSWWITNIFPPEIMLLVKAIKGEFLNPNDTNCACRIIVNGHTSGFSDYKHQDLDHYGQGLTFLLFLNDNWKPEYDGDFKIYYEEEQSISILPSLGKLLIFDGSIPHRASSVSREFAGLRLSLALQYNSVADAGKMLSHFSL